MDFNDLHPFKKVVLTYIAIKYIYSNAINDSIVHAIIIQLI